MWGLYGYRNTRAVERIGDEQAVWLYAGPKHRNRHAETEEGLGIREARECTSPEILYGEPKPCMGKRVHDRQRPNPQTLNPEA